MRIELDAAGLAMVEGSTDALFRDELGPAIRDDAKRYCPKAGDDALADSIESHLEGHSLIVSATGGHGRAYAADVELGHRIVAWGHVTGRVEHPEPFLRPALYQERGQ